MEFIPKWQSNSNAGWLTWKFMSNVVNTGFTIIIDSTVCPQFGRKYSKVRKEKANEKKIEGLYSPLLSENPRSVCSPWGFNITTKNFLVWCKFCSLFVFIKRVYLKLFLWTDLQLEKGLGGLSKLLVMKTCVYNVHESSRDFCFCHSLNPSPKLEFLNFLAVFDKVWAQNFVLKSV